jgi:hypothetical protein
MRYIRLRKATYSNILSNMIEHVSSYFSGETGNKAALTAITDRFHFEHISSVGDSIKCSVNVFEQVKDHRRVSA